MLSPHGCVHWCRREQNETKRRLQLDADSDSSHSPSDSLETLDFCASLSSVLLGFLFRPLAVHRLLIANGHFSFIAVISPASDFLPFFAIIRDPLSRVTKSYTTPAPHTFCSSLLPPRRSRSFNLDYCGTPRSTFAFPLVFTQFPAPPLRGRAHPSSFEINRHFSSHCPLRSRVLRVMPESARRNVSTAL